jgi:hypothetical protein
MTRRVPAAEILAIQAAEAGKATPIYDLSVANSMILAGFTEADVISIVGYMPDLNQTLDEVERRSGIRAEGNLKSDHAGKVTSSRLPDQPSKP